MKFAHSVACAVREIIRTDPEMHFWFEHHESRFSPAAADRASFWTRKFLRYLAQIPGPFQRTPPVAYPDSWAKAVRAHGAFTDAQVSDSYFFLSKLVKFSLEFGGSFRDPNLIIARDIDATIRNPHYELVSGNGILFDLEVADPVRSKVRSRRSRSGRSRSGRSRSKSKSRYNRCA